MNRNLKTGLIVVGILLIVIIVFPTLFEFLTSNDEIGDVVFELEVIQTGIQAFMVDNHLDTVTPSTSGRGGEKIRGTGTQFHDTFILRDYMDQDSTWFCYWWRSDGRIISQFDVNADGNCAIDGEWRYP